MRLIMLYRYREKPLWQRACDRIELIISRPVHRSLHDIVASWLTHRGVNEALLLIEVSPLDYDMVIPTFVMSRDKLLAYTVISFNNASWFDEVDLQDEQPLTDPWQSPLVFGKSRCDMFRAGKALDNCVSRGLSKPFGKFQFRQRGKVDVRMPLARVDVTYVQWLLEQAMNNGRDISKKVRKPGVVVAKMAW